MSSANQNTIVITYCTECGYLPLAKRLAERIKEELGIIPDLIGGHGGVYAVSVEEKEIFNNLKEGGGIPSDAHILKILGAKINPEERGVKRPIIFHDVMNPMGYPPQIQPTAMAQRLDQLNGKTVYLVDARFDDSDRFLQQMQHWFEEHHPDTKTVFVSKSGVYTEEDWELWEEIQNKGDAMIMGVGH